MIIAVDPGTSASAFVLMHRDFRIVNFAKVSNQRLLEALGREGFRTDDDILAIETINSSYGMGVGEEVFKTVFWSGRFVQAWGGKFMKMNRPQIKTHLCGTPRAKDGNVILALKDRFGGKGTKAAPGWFYGFSRDIWQAYACGITAIESPQTIEKVE